MCCNCHSATVDGQKNPARVAEMLVCRYLQGKQQKSRRYHNGKGWHQWRDGDRTGELLRSLVRMANYLPRCRPNSCLAIALRWTSSGPSAKRSVRAWA